MNRRIVLAFCALALLGTARPLAAQDQFPVDSALAKTGETLFAAKACLGCHTIGKGGMAAPDLSGLFDRRSVAWVRKWLRDPEKMLETDDTAKKMLKEYNDLRMPNINLKDDEIAALMHYIARETKAAEPIRK